MPLRDHFHPPLDDETHWEGFHSGWPMMIVASLAKKLPPRYVAAPSVRLGVAVEIDVAAFEKANLPVQPKESGNGGLATAVWAPPQPALAVETDLPSLDEYEVRVFDTKRGRRLVAAIEIVSPGNKDRPDHRNAFVAKCVALLENRVCVSIVDLVTTRNFNLYAELLGAIGQADPAMGSHPPGIYAVACRARRGSESWLLEGWSHALAIGQPLPTLPLWLAEDFAVPVDLEESYEETCKVLRIS